MFHYLVPTFSALLLLASCSGHQFQRPESIEAKMSRFENKNTNQNEVPEIALATEGVESFKSPSHRGRAPASVMPEVEGSSDKVESSNKKLYFMSLFSQYEKIRSFAPAGSTQNVNICPSFHTGVVEWREGQSSARKIQMGRSVPFKYNAKMIGSTSYIAQYPELSLPLTDDVHGPTVAALMLSRPQESFKVEGERLMSQALHGHATRVYKELGELCETGTSANYYNFENLLTHARTHRDLVPSEYALKVLMKTTVVSNMVLIESIESVASKGGRAPASVDIYTDEALDRLGTPWALEYLKSVIQKRDR